MDPQLQHSTDLQQQKPVDPPPEDPEKTEKLLREDKEDEKLTPESNSEQKGRELDESNDAAPVSLDQQKQAEQEELIEAVAPEEEPSPEKTGAEGSSDEDMAIMNKSEALELFNKMTKESIQKLMQSDSSGEGSSSEGTSNEKDIDEMINSNPQDLIMMNGHAHTQHKSNAHAEHSKESTENHAEKVKAQTEIREESKISQEEKKSITEGNLEGEGVLEEAEVKQKAGERALIEDQFQENEEEEQPHEFNEEDDEEEERQLSDREIREKLK